MDIMGMLQKAQELKKNFEQTQAELEQLTISGAAGGGMVSADVNGMGNLKRIKIDRSVINPDDPEMLEDLVVVAVAEAQRKAADEQKLRTGKLSEGLPFKLPF